MGDARLGLLTTLSLHYMTFWQKGEFQIFLLLT